MLRSLSILLALLLSATTASAQLTRYYETTNKHTKKLTDHSLVRFDQKDGGQIALHFEEGLTDYVQQEEYLFDANYKTLNFSVTNAQTQTGFKGWRQENSIVIQGQFNGKPADRTLKIDDAPFYAFPKFNLARFVLSNEKKITFWAMRHDDLSVYKMIATREGQEKILVNGQPINAIKVYFTTVDLLFRVFKRTYYFRPSDGLFLKQEYPDGRVRELIKEE